MYLCLFFYTDGRLSGLNLNCNNIYMTEIQCGSDQPFRKVSEYQFETRHMCLYPSYLIHIIYCYKI
jgi:hypothetical protein